MIRFAIAVNLALAMGACSSAPDAPTWKPPPSVLKATPGRWNGYSNDEIIVARNEALKICRAEMDQAMLTSNIDQRLGSMRSLHRSYQDRALNEHFRALWSINEACLLRRGFTMYPKDDPS